MPTQASKALDTGFRRYDGKKHTPKAVFNSIFVLNLPLDR